MLLIVVALEGSRPFTIVSTSSSVTLRKLKVSFLLITSLILRIDGCFSYFLIAFCTGSKILSTFVMISLFICYPEVEQH